MAITQLNTSEFDQAVSGEELSVIDFFAVWCGPCKMFAPVVERMANQFQDVHFYKVDIDEEPELAERFRVMSVPTLVYLKKGQVVGKSMGVVSPAEMEQTINKAKASA